MPRSVSPLPALAEQTVSYSLATRSSCLIHPTAQTRPTPPCISEHTSAVEPFSSYIDEGVALTLGQRYLALSKEQLKTLELNVLAHFYPFSQLYWVFPAKWKTAANGNLMQTTLESPCVVFGDSRLLPLTLPTSWSKQK